MRKHELARKLGVEEGYNLALRGSTDARVAERLDGYYVNEVEATDRLVSNDARTAVLAVALMLKNRADASDVAEGSHVQRVIDDYARVQSYLNLLGNITEAERAAATALWDETAA